MAGRTQTCASVGCMGICFLFVVALWMGGRVDGGAPGIDPPVFTPPAAPIPQPAPAPRQLHVGPRGGCYYITDSGDKEYVDRSACAGAVKDVHRASDSPRVDPPAPLLLPEAVPAERPRPAPPPRQLRVGPRGGCYYVTDSGDKEYVDRSECAGAAEDVYRGSDPVRADPSTLFLPEAVPAERPGRAAPASRQLHVGPRGGCYYINDNGNKTYVDRSECY